MANSDVRITGDSSIFRSENTTQFYQTKVAESRPQLVLNADLPISERRDSLTEDNGATVTKQDAEYRLRATSTANSLAKLATRQRGNYISGSTFQSGLGIRIPEQPTGDAYIKWGYFNGSQGLYFLYNATGIYTVIQSNGVEVAKTKQQDWNEDRLDGSNDSKRNRSGAELDLSDGHVAQIDFLYYGYGDVEFKMSARKDNKRGNIITVDSRNVSGQITIAEPNLPLAIEVNSGTSGQQLDAYVGGRQFSIVGQDDRIARTTEGTRLARGISTAWRPLISFRHKSGFENIAVRLAGLDIFSTVDGLFELQRNATLDGSADFSYVGNQTEGEKAVEIDISAGDTYTSGECIYRGSFEGGTGAVSNSRTSILPERPVSELDTITLAARTLSGTGTIDLAILRILEDW